MSTRGIDIRRIDIRRMAWSDGPEWRVWLPHSCSPDEPVGDEHDQQEWGDFYFLTFGGAVEFVRQTLMDKEDQ